MSIIFGSARIGENGKTTGGKAGDQKQTTSNDFAGEVSMQNFYVHSKGWYIVRAKDVSVANKLAEAMKTACNNANIGYDQNERLGIVKNGVSSTVKTEADCSSAVRACCIYAGFDPGNFTTGNEITALANTGKFENKVKYISDAKTPLYTGDILVTCTKGHTGIIVEGNSRTESSPACYPRYTGLSSSIVSVLKVLGEADTSLSHRKKIAIANGITGYSGTASQNLKMVSLAKAGALKKA